MTFRTVPRLSAALGAEIRGLDLSRPLDAPTVAALRAAWLEHLVLVFRGQKLDVEAQARFARYFGDTSETQAPDERSMKHNPDRRVLLITNIRENGRPVGFLPDGELQFHSDSAFLDRPLMATVLYAVEIPDRGGETLFANAYRAYETLDAETKERLAGLRAFNIYDYATQVKSGTLARAGAAAGGSSRHPHPPRDRAQGGLRQPAYDRGDPRPAARRRRGAAENPVRGHRTPGLRLRACLAEG